MKNIQIIDGAQNCVYDIFAATDKQFLLLFPRDTDIAFIDEIYAREDEKAVSAALTRMWTRPVRKSKAQGIHGILFYQLEEKKAYYPTRRDRDAVNPGGTRLR
ncbi:MAG: hypothetical protein JWN73_4405 [Betaproteobacteria bacterium]|nr:hypothetical protein [Betaproteobacteria bacterium]